MYPVCTFITLNTTGFNILFTLGALSFVQLWFSVYSSFFVFTFRHHLYPHYLLFFIIRLTSIAMINRHWLLFVRFYIIDLYLLFIFHFSLFPFCSVLRFRLFLIFFFFRITPEPFNSLCFAFLFLNRGTLFLIVAGCKVNIRLILFFRYICIINFGMIGSTIVLHCCVCFCTPIMLIIFFITGNTLCIWCCQINFFSSHILHF